MLGTWGDTSNVLECALANYGTIVATGFAIQKCAAVVEIAGYRMVGMMMRGELRKA